MKKIIILIGIIGISFNLSAQLLDTVPSTQARVRWTEFRDSYFNTNMITIEDTITSNSAAIDTNTARLNDTTTLNAAMQDVDSVLINNSGVFGLPTYSSNPTTTREGFLYYNSSTNRIRYWNGSTWTEL